MYGDFPAKSTVCTPYIPIDVWFVPTLHMDHAMVCVCVYREGSALSEAKDDDEANAHAIVNWGRHEEGEHHHHTYATYGLASLVNSAGHPIKSAASASRQVWGCQCRCRCQCRCGYVCVGGGGGVAMGMRMCALWFAYSSNR